MIDDFTDDEVRALLDTTGDIPTREFRAGLGDLLADEASDDRPTAVVRPIESVPSSRRHWWMPVTAAAAIVALLGGFVLLGGNDDTTVPATDPDTGVTQTTLDLAATVPGLIGRRLVQIDATSSQLPTLTITSFDPTGPTMSISGYDGCTDYDLPLQLDDANTVFGSLVDSDVNGCPSSSLPMDGDTVTVLTNGLDITRDGATHGFRALDSLALVTSSEDLDGSWNFDGTTVWSISGDEIAIGDCWLTLGFSRPGWIVPIANDGQSLGGSDQARSCFPDDQLPAALRDVESIPGHEIRRVGDLLIVEVRTGTRPVFRLELDAGVGAPGQIPDDLFGRTWVMIDFPSSRLPWMRFNSLSSVQGGVGVDSFDGCNGRSGTFELNRGVVANSSVGTSYVLCQGITPATPIADGTVLSLELDQPRDILTVTTGDESTRYVALESFGSITGASDIVGNWSLDDEHVMTLLADGESMEAGSTEIKIGSCDAGWQIESGVRLIIDVEDRPTPCRIDPLVLDPLVQGLAVGNNEVYRTGPNTLTVVIAGRDVYRLNATVETVLASTGDPEVDGFLEAAAGSTWVLLPSADEDPFQIDRPYLTIGDPRTGALALDGYSGCTSVNSESAWQHGPDGFTVAVAAARACRGQLPLDLVDFNIVDDQLVVTRPDGESVSLDRLEVIADPASIDGRWQTSGITDSELVIDRKDFRLRLAGCTTRFKIGTSVGSLGTTGWESNAADCTGDELSLSRALVESTITAHVTPTGDMLILEARSATHRTLVFALPYLGPVVDPNTISFEHGSAFGYREGDVVTADDALAHVATLLGPPTHDTGWFDTTPDPTITDHEDCMGARTIRTLWWHDFSLSFFEHQGVEQLWTWTVGDTRITRHGDRREPYLPALSDKSELTSDSDIPIGIGSTTSDLVDAYGNQATALNTTPDLFDDGAVFWSVGSTGFQVLVRDDIVIGFGAQISFC